MKVFNLIYVIVFFAINSGFALAQSELNFSQLNLQVSTNKQEYLPLEPISFRLSLSNPSNQRVRGHTAITFTSHLVSLLVQKSDGSIVEIDQLSSSKPFSRVKCWLIQPGYEIVENETLLYQLNRNFITPGVYQIRVAVQNCDSEQKLLSQPVGITISQPVGTNLLAFNFLMSKTESATVFNGLEAEKNIPLLEEFTKEFEDSGYSDYVTLTLGKMYFFRNEYEKAGQKFDKLISKENFAGSSEAAKFLTKIKEKVDKTNH